MLIHTTFNYPRLNLRPYRRLDPIVYEEPAGKKALSRRNLVKYELYVRVRPGLDSRLDILEPLFDPVGIRERAFVGVRIVADRFCDDRSERGDVDRLPGVD